MNVTESVVLCLQAWRGEVLTGRARPDWQHPSPLLRGAMDDADAFDFVRDIFDEVALPSDAFTAAAGLHALSQESPESLPKHLRLALRVGGIASFGLPWGVMPLVKGRFRAHLSDILISGAIPKPQEEGVRAPRVLREVLADARDAGADADVRLLGAPVHGPEGVRREADRLVQLAHTPRLTRLTVPLRRLVPTLSAWEADTVPSRFISAAEAVFEACIAARVRCTIAVEAYAEALLVPALVREIQRDARWESLQLGVEVLAELPESVDIVHQILREADPTCDLELRLSTRSIAPGEAIRSVDQGLAVPSLTEPDDLGQQWSRLVSILTAPESLAVLTPVFATEDATFIAIAQVLWSQRATDQPLTVCLARGRTPELEQALRAVGVSVVTAVAYVLPAEFGHGLPWVLETLAAAVNDNSPLKLLDAIFGEDGERAISAERTRVARITERLPDPPTSHRLQDRAREWAPSERDSPLMYRPPTEAYRFDTGGLTAAVMNLHRGADARVRVTHEAAQRIPVISDTGFANEPDTDAAQPRNRTWVRRHLHEAQQSSIGAPAVANARTGVWALEPVMVAAQQAGATWAGWAHADRATVLRRGALGLVAARDRLVEVIASERGLPAAEIDAEIGAAIDSARYYAHRAEGLRSVRGARFTPVHLTVVAANEHTSPGELVEMMLATLAAGSGVALVVHESIARTAAIVIEELTSAGLLEGAVTLIVPPEQEPFAECLMRVIERPELERLMAAVSADTAVMLRRRAPALPRDVRVRSHGTVLVTPSADVSAVIREVVQSAFAGAGGHHRAARGLVLTGGLAKQRAFLDELADAVRAIHPGHSGRRAVGDEGTDPLRFTMAPLPTRPTASQLRALSTLAEGESWLVEPEKLDEEGVLWSPGVRLGVRAEADFWADAIGVPVIGVTGAHSLQDGIEKQHAIGGGTVAAIQSLSADEVIPWLEHTRAAALAVNKATTRARIERFPSGIWRDDQSTWQPLAGAAGRLTPLGSWTLRRGTQSETLHLRGLEPVIRTLIEAAQPDLTYDDFDLVRRAALADELAWRTQFGAVRDISGLSTEHNIVRYLSVPVHIRWSAGEPLSALVRLIAAGLLTGTQLTVSCATLLPPALRDILEAHRISHVFEADDAWLERASVQGSAVAGEGEVPAERIRYLGGDGIRVTEWLRSRADIGVWSHPVTMAGPVELLGFLREQAVSIATTRHGMRATIPELDEWITELSEV